MQHPLGQLVINPRGRQNGKYVAKSSIAYQPTLCGCRLVEASSDLAMTRMRCMGIPGECPTNRGKARKTL